MPWLYILCSAAVGILCGMVLADCASAKRRAADLRVAEERAFKLGEVAAWREATQRLRARGTHV